MAKKKPAAAFTVKAVEYVEVTFPNAVTQRYSSYAPPKITSFTKRLTEVEARDLAVALKDAANEIA